MKPTEKLQRLLDEFEEAVRAHAWIGSREPESHAEIERGYLASKNRLLEALGLPEIDCIESNQ